MDDVQKPSLEYSMLLGGREAGTNHYRSTGNCSGPRLAWSRNDWQLCWTASTTSPVGGTRFRSAGHWRLNGQGVRAAEPAGEPRPAKLTRRARGSMT